MKVSPFRPAETYEAARVAFDAFVREVSSALNGGLLLRENSRVEIKDVLFIEGTTLAVKTRLPSQPLEVRVLRARRSDTESSSTSGNLVTWSYANGFVSISAIGSLTASASYLVTLAIVEG
jgi:hypothetical protein